MLTCICRYPTLQMAVGTTCVFCYPPLQMAVGTTYIALHMCMLQHGLSGVLYAFSAHSLRC